jgi:hypothetical protein
MAPAHFSIPSQIKHYLMLLTGKNHNLFVFASHDLPNLITLAIDSFVKPV